MGSHPTKTRISRALAVLAVFLCTLGVARADETLAVLGIDSQEVGDPVGVALTEALRKNVALQPGIKLVAGKDLIEMKMVFSCDGEAPACLAQAGRSLGADKLLYGTLHKADGARSIAVSLKILDVKDLTVSKAVNDTVARKTFTGPILNAAATRWVGQLVATPQLLGGIAVQSTPSNANVLLDDASVGHTPLRLRDIHVGPHVVTVQLDGYEKQTHNVDVHVGAIDTVVARLEKAQAPVANVDAPKPGPSIAPVETPTPIVDEAPLKPRKPGRPAQYAAIGLGAGAVVSAAIAIYTWRHYVGLEHDAHNDLTALATPAASNDLRTFLQHPSCSSPPAGASAATAPYLSHCQSGQKWANATTGLWVSAGVLATASIVSLIVGDRLNANAANKDRTSGQKLQQSLRLVPAIGTTGGGLQASFEF